MKPPPFPVTLWNRESTISALPLAPRRALPPLRHRLLRHVLLLHPVMVMLRLHVGAVARRLDSVRLRRRRRLVSESETRG